MEGTSTLMSVIGRQSEPEESTTGGGAAADAHKLRRRVAGSVAAVTTVADDGFRASTVTAFVVTSFEPFLFLVSLDNDGSLTEELRRSRVFALSLLTWPGQLLADRFAGFAPR